MDLSESGLANLPLPEQVFAVVNAERIDRGLPPIEDMTAQLDAYAQSGADSGSDPTFPSTVTGGAPITCCCACKPPRQPTKQTRK